MSLKRSLSLLDVFCIAAGAMISSGLFILPGIAHAHAGPAVVLSYLIAALLAMTGMFSQAELVSAMPKSGGTYFYVTRSLGPAVGMIDGLITWFSLSLKSAFALVGMAAFTAIVVPWLNIHCIAVGFCVVFVALNLIGIKEAGRAQVLMVAGLLGILAFYVIKGIPSISIAYFEPFAPHGSGAVFATAGFVFVSYGGLLKIASIAEEVSNPSRVIPLSMMLALFVVSLIYMLVVFVTAGVLGSENLDNSLTPLSDGAAVFAGTPGRILLSIAAILAFVSTANAGIMASARYLFASSRDGGLPSIFSRINTRCNTPHVAIITTGAFILGALFLDLTILVKAASGVLILTYMFSCLSVIIIRESRLQNYRPCFHAPLYPWLQIAGICGFSLLLICMGMTTILILCGFIAGALFLYWFSDRIQQTREYALLYLIERIAAREITDHTLETELKDIIHERDEIVKDRFDYLVEQTGFIDMSGPLSRDDLFERAARELSQTLHIPVSVLTAKLHERENQSTTALTPFLAIPHIIVPGEHTFSLLGIRCLDGIFFSEASPAVKAVFFMAGSLDERPFHLRALAALAGIVQETDFESRWLAARDSASLRDILLLGKRRRYINH